MRCSRATNAPKILFARGSILNDYLPLDIGDWLKYERPDAARLLVEVSDELKDVVSVGDQRRFIKAIATCASMFLQVSDVYEKEILRAMRLRHAPLPLQSWLGFVRQQPDTGNPHGHRAALRLLGVDVSTAPAPLSEGDQANGPAAVSS